MSGKEASSMRLVFSLGIAGLISGLLLVGIFKATEPVIAQNRDEALKKAIFKVLPGTVSFSVMVKDGQRLASHDEAQGKPPSGEVVYAGKNKLGHFIGYAIPGAGAGFADTIKLIYGYDPQRQVIVGMQVLESRETPGLGDKIITDDAFLANFKALAVQPSIVPVKKGEKSKPNELDCITGATISSKAVTSILNNSTSFWLPLLKESEQTGREDK